MDDMIIHSQKGIKPSGVKQRKVLSELLGKKLDESVIHRGNAKLVSQALVDELVLQALQGQSWALTMLWERLEGKVPQKIEDTDGNTLLTPLIYLPDNKRSYKIVREEGENGEDEDENNRLSAYNGAETGENGFEEGEIVDDETF